MVSITGIESPDSLHCRSQGFDPLPPKISQHQALIATSGGLQKGHSDGVSQPAPLIDDPSLLARPINDPYRRWLLPFVGTLEEVPDVLAAVKPQRILGKVQVQPPAFDIYTEVISVGRKTHSWDYGIEKEG